MRRALPAALLALLAGCSSFGSRCPPAPVPEAAQFRQARWDELPGWREDRLEDLWPALLASCSRLAERREWHDTCAAASALRDPAPQHVRAFLEQQLVPWQILRRRGSHIEAQGLITGYYEPLLAGSRVRTERYTVPLYGPPPDLLDVELGTVYPELAGRRVRARLVGRKVVPYYTRAELESRPPEGSEVAWVADPFDAFLLQVQGSGRVQLPDGEVIRLQYADQNGQPYRAVGRYLTDRGEIPPGQASVPAIRAWLAAHPERTAEVLDSNPSVVFFTTAALGGAGGDAGAGPRGALGVSLTAQRSVAVDARIVPLGAPLFLATTFPGTGLPLARVVLAQDTGGAIRGAVRADFFWGLGSAAGDLAGRMREQGRMWLLWPRSAPVASDFRP